MQDLPGALIKPGSDNKGGPLAGAGAAAAEIFAERGAITNGNIAATVGADGLVTVTRVSDDATVLQELARELMAPLGRNDTRNPHNLNFHGVFVRDCVCGFSAPGTAAGPWPAGNGHDHRHQQHRGRLLQERRKDSKQTALFPPCPLRHTSSSNSHPAAVDSRGPAASMSPTGTKRDGTAVLASDCHYNSKPPGFLNQRWYTICINLK